MNKTNQHIALFPLQLFLLPGEYTQLYIFEERYKQLVNESILHQKPFGISFTGKGNNTNIGSLVEVSEVLKTHKSGAMDILVKATGLFRLNSFNMQQAGKPYPGANVDLTIEIDNKEAGNELKQAFVAILEKDQILNDSLLAKSSFNILEIAIELMMSDNDKLDFCLCTDYSERERFLLNYIRYINFQKEQEASVYHNIYLN